MLKYLLEKQWVRYVLTLMAGVAIGAVFYPTKRVEEKIKKKYEEEIQRVYERNASSEEKWQELYSSVSEEYRSYQKESNNKLESLTTTIRDLKSKQKTAYYKLVKPDGTIEERQFSESEVNESTQVVTQIRQEFQEKVQSIEQKWSDIHRQRLTEVKKQFEEKEQTYVKRIEELERSKVTTVNEKRFGAEVGMDTDRDYYIHGTGNIFGPVFMGVHGETSKEFNSQSIGLGLGIQF